MMRKFLFVPAALLGAVFGFICHDAILAVPGTRGWRDAETPVVLASLLLVYVLLTAAIFRVRRDTFGLSRTQLRVIWLAAFPLGAVGAPLLLEWGVR